MICIMLMQAILQTNMMCGGVLNTIAVLSVC